MRKLVLSALIAATPLFVMGTEAKPTYRSNSYYYLGPDLMAYSKDMNHYVIPTAHLGIGHRIQSNRVGWDVFAGAALPLPGAGTQLLYFPSMDTTSPLYLGMGIKGYLLLPFGLPGVFLEPFLSIGREILSAEGKNTHFWQISLGPRVGAVDLAKLESSWNEPYAHFQWSYGLYF